MAGNDTTKMFVDSSGTKDGVHLISPDGFHQIQAARFDFIASKIVRGELSHLIGDYSLLYSNQGSIIIRPSGNSRPLLVPPKSVVFLRDESCAIQFARGSHDHIVFQWSKEETPCLARWLFDTPQVGSSRCVFAQPSEFDQTGTLARLIDAWKDPVTAELRTIGIALEVIPLLATRNDKTELAPLPANLPDTIAQLTNQVRKNPAGSWPLKDAADQAGYSPFHFSRVFKGLVGYGFHEFVDRCRTANAIEHLMDSDSAVDSIANAAGFGTTQGLRESVKEYLGLVPSELRMIPEQVR